MNEHTFYKSIAKLIKAERVKQGISHRHLAELIGVSRPNIIHVETGYINVGLYKLVKIAKALKVPFNDLMPKQGGK